MNKSNHRRITFNEDKKKNYYNYNTDNNLNKLDKNMCILEFMIIYNRKPELFK